MPDPLDGPNLIPLGAIWHKRLQNRDTWTDANDKTTTITQMTPEHRSNVRRYLRRHMARLELVTSLYLLQTLPRDEESWTDEVVDALAIQTPLEWLYSQPLFQALVAADDPDHFADPT